MVCTVLLGNKKLIGLGELLSRKINASEAIHETGIENLWVMPSGALLPNPAELLARSDMSEIMRDLGERFERHRDRVRAPVTAVSDTLLLLEHAQANLPGRPRWEDGAEVDSAGAEADRGGWVAGAGGSDPEPDVDADGEMPTATTRASMGSRRCTAPMGTYVEREKKEEVEVVEGQPRF